MKPGKVADSEAELADATMVAVEAVDKADDKVETEASEIGTVGETVADKVDEEVAPSEVRL